MAVFPDQSAGNGPDQDQDQVDIIEYPEYAFLRFYRNDLWRPESNDLLEIIIGDLPYPESEQAGIERRIGREAKEQKIKERRSGRLFSDNSSRVSTPVTRGWR